MKHLWVDGPAVVQGRTPGKRTFTGYDTRITGRSRIELFPFSSFFMLAERHANSVVVRAPAKVNLFLEVLRKRPDGYHEIVTFIVAVSLYDTLSFKEEPSGEIRLTCTDAKLSAGPANLVWRVADLVRQYTGCRRGVHIHLLKRIPVAAGLGGGSSDAAATLIGLDRLWDLRLSRTEQMKLASTLGSDIPFFLTTPAAWCTGRGEQVMPAPLKRPLHFVLACPPVGLATAEVYRHVAVPARPRSPEALRRALEAGNVAAIGAALHNRLQPAAERLCPAVAALRRLFDGLGPAGHGMSGSGPSYLALCRDRTEARTLARRVRQQWQRNHRPQPGGLGPKLRVFVVHSLSAKEKG